MFQTVSLNIGDRSFEIPAMQFVAGWVALFEYVNQESESNADLELERRSLTMFAECGDGEHGRIRFASIETLCRILGDSADWRLNCDSGFFDRNQWIVLRTSSTFGCLTAEVIWEWQCLPSREKNAFEKCADALIFPCLLAHGQSQE